MSKDKSYTAEEIRDLFVKDNPSETEQQEIKVLLEKLINSKQLNLVPDILKKTEDNYNTLYKSKISNTQDHSPKDWKKLLSSQKTLFRSFEIYKGNQGAKDNTENDTQDHSFLYMSIIKNFAKAFPMTFVSIVNESMEQMFEQINPDYASRDYTFDELAQLIKKLDEDLDSKEKSLKQQYLQEFSEWPEFINDILGKTLDNYFTKYLYQKDTSGIDHNKIWSKLDITEQHLFRKLELYNDCKSKSSTKEGIAYCYEKYTEILKYLNQLGRDESSLLKEHFFRELKQYKGFEIIDENDSNLHNNKELLKALIEAFTKAYPDEVEESLHHIEAQYSQDQIPSSEQELSFIGNEY